jgi:integrase
MNGTTFKRCGCKVAVLDRDGHPVLDARGRPTRRELGAGCPQLRRRSGRWSERHGSWWFLLEVPAPAGGRRMHIRQGGHACREDAEQAMQRVWRLLAVADDAHNPAAARVEVTELVRAAIRARQPLPDPDELRRRLVAGVPLNHRITVGHWLTEWLTAKTDIRPATLRSYTTHVRLYLTPHLGEIPLARLRVGHLHAMFTALTERNTQIAEENTARRALEQAAAAARRRGDRDTARVARARLAALPGYGRPVGPATIQRIRATLRAALADAAAQQLVTVNVAKLVKLATARRPKPLVWTGERVAHWRTTGQRPAPVMVWTAAQTAAFLGSARRHRLHALYHLIAVTGLRRGEACGLRWSDLDLAAGTATIRWQIIQLGWATAEGPPKSDAGERVLALDAGTTAVLAAHRRRQHAERIAAGHARVDTDLVFTQPGGAPLHPARVTDQFTRLTRAAELPPIRLHDLRHGAATHALAAGVDIRIVQDMLGHSSSTITRDTYTSVVDEAKHTAAEALARILTRTGPAVQQARRSAH